MSATYRTTCPECGGNNYVVWYEDNRGTYCFNCEYSEKDSSKYKPKPIKRSSRINEIRLYYLELADYWHSCLTTEHRMFLYSRGVSDHSINTLKLGYCPPNYHPLYGAEIAAEAGIYYKGHIQLADRITFPFLVDGNVTDFYGRSLDPVAQVRYLGLFGGSWKRGADYVYCHDYLYKPNAFTRVVRTEGLIKAIVSNQYGISCVAYPGTLAYRPSSPPMIDQTQVICFDNQQRNRRELISAIKKEANRYTNVKIATLPLRKKDKADIDAYIFTYGVEDYKRVIDNALEYDVWKQLVK